MLFHRTINSCKFPVQIRVLLLIFVLYSPVSCLAQEWNEHTFLAGGFDEYRQVRHFFSNMNADTEREFRFHPSPKISIYGNWLAIPMRCEIEGGRLEFEKQLKDEFLGFVEGRLNVEIPNWWKEEIRAFDLRRSTNEWQVPQMSAPGDMQESNGIRHPADTIISELTQLTIVGNVAEVDFEIPFEFDFSVKEQWVDCVAVIPASDGRAVATCKSQLGVRHDLICFNSDQKLLWKSEVKTHPEFSLGSSGPSRRAFVQLVSNGTAVAVFGVNHRAAYLEVFDLENGAVICRFSTFQPAFEE